MKFQSIHADWTWKIIQEIVRRQEAHHDSSLVACIEEVVAIYGRSLRVSIEETKKKNFMKLIIGKNWSMDNNLHKFLKQSKKNLGMSR